MKSPRCSSFFKTLLLIGSLAFCFGSLTVVKAGDSDPLFIGAGRPEALDHHTDLAEGYLKVYSATDKVNDGGLAYYSHSSYAIYTIDGSSLKEWKITFRAKTKVLS